MDEITRKPSQRIVPSGMPLQRDRRPAYPLRLFGRLNNGMYSKIRGK